MGKFYLGLGDNVAEHQNANAPPTIIFSMCRACCKLQAKPPTGWWSTLGSPPMCRTCFKFGYQTALTVFMLQSQK